MLSHLPMVSVLIPAHNEQKHIAEAIESVVYQKTKFPVEIIVIDDCSSDNTFKIAETYANNYINIKIIRNEFNRGKGFCIKNAYNGARGKFIHVLDADDIFTSWDKLQRQVDILLKHTDCFAVAHNTLFLSPEDQGRIVPGVKADTVLSYQQFNKSSIYCHTSSYLFRRLENGLPEYFERKGMRGDTALAFFHAFSTRKSVYVMHDVMSLYHIHGNGIWSGLDERSKSELNIAVLKDLQTFVVRDPDLPEYRALEARISMVETETTQVKPADQAPAVDPTIDDIVQDCERTAAEIFRPEIRAQAFQAMYSLPAVDRVMETIGRALLFEQGFVLKDRRHDPAKVVLLVSGFVPNGGGIFREIKEIIAQLLKDGTKVEILSTGKIATAQDIIDTHFSDPLISYHQLDTSQPTSGQIRQALRFLIDAAPDRLYPFITHHDVVGLAAMQRGLARQIVFDYVYDHGLSLGVHSSAIDCIVAKTHSQASALAPVIDPSRIGLLAPFFTERFAANPYRPLKNSQLTTASAAARSYKVESAYRYSYFDVILSALSAVDMRHVHYGPLSDDVRSAFLDRLRAAGISEDQFIHIPWADDLGASLLENGVDVFIAPFPICSARIGIEVMCCGIPSLNHRAILPGLPEAGDFADPDQPGWTTPEDLIATLTQLTAPRLSELSASARTYFGTTNASSVALGRFVAGDFDAPQIDAYPRFTLNDLAREPFFDRSLSEDHEDTVPVVIEDTVPVVIQVATTACHRPKFWHKTPARRRMRAMFYRLRKPTSENE